MFATPAVTFHTLLSLVAILAGIFVMSMLVKNRRPDVWTLVFLVTMIATDVTGFLLPAPKLLPSHITGIISLALIALALLAHYRFHFSGAWRSIYAVGRGLSQFLRARDAAFPEGAGAACPRAKRAGQSRAAIPDRAGHRAGDLRLADLEVGQEFPARRGVAPVSWTPSTPWVFSCLVVL
jgi:hypothetical protein